MEHIPETEPVYDVSGESVSDLTPTQQQILDCVSCHTVNGLQLEATNAAQCNNMSINTVRSALQSLETNNFIVNSKPPGKRRNKFTTTALGLQQVTPELNPWECSTKDEVIAGRPLAANAQKARDCASCLTSSAQEITISALVRCGLGEPGARYGLSQLVERGYLARNQDRSPGSQVVYTATHKLTPYKQFDADCGNKAESNAASQPVLTDFQRKLLDCIGCQAKQRLVPDRKRASQCLEADSQSVRRAAQALVAAKAIKPGPILKPGLRSSSLIQSYKLTKSKNSTLMPLYVEGCDIKLTEQREVHDRLSEERKKALGCLACVHDQIARSSTLPGSTSKIIEQCSKLPSSLITNFVDDLTADGYYEKLTGYERNQWGNVFYRPTVKGRGLLALHQIENQNTDMVCKNDLESITNPPNNLREQLIDCLSCIWTRQTATRQPLGATAKMLIDCPRTTIASSSAAIMREYVDSGDVQKALVRGEHGGWRNIYTPTTSTRIMLGYKRACANNPVTYAGSGTTTEEYSDLLVPDDQDMSLVLFKEFADNVEISTDGRRIYYSNSNLIRSNYRLLTAEQEAMYAVIIQTSHDKALVERSIQTFVASNVRLAYWAENRMPMARHILGLEDTLQVAMMGVHSAVLRFDANHGTKFSTYAAIIIRQEMNKAIAEATGIERRFIEMIPKLHWCIKDFEQRRGRRPEVNEIAEVLNKRTNFTMGLIDAYGKVQAAAALNRVSSAAAQNKPYIEPGGLRDTERQGIAAVVSSGVFDAAIKFMDSDERLILQEILQGKLSREDFSSTSYKMSLQKEIQYLRVMSIIRHPHFGFGPILDSAILDWQKDAACADEAYESIVVADNTKDYHYPCKTCPVFSLCKSFASTKDIPVTTGIWAGTPKLR